jgi:hypothetical protein
MATRSSALAATQALTNFASGYANDRISQSILADAYFLTGQPIPAALNFEYAQFDRADGITIPNTKTALNDPVGAILAFGGTKVTGTLDPHRATTDWYDVGPSITDADLLLQLQGGAKMGTQALVTGRFKRILDAASTAAGAAAETITADETEAVSQIQTVVQTVQKACAGYCDINILFGAGAFQLFSNATKVQGRLSGGATRNNPATPTEQDIERLIGYNVKVKVTNAVYNSAAVGQTATGAFLLNNSIYVAAVSPTPSREDPSALKIFAGYGDNGFTPTYIRNPNPQYEACTWGWKEQIVATNSGAIKLVAIQAT